MQRRVLVIDDNTAFRARGAVSSSRTNGFVVVAGGRHGRERRPSSSVSTQPDLVIVDVQLPDTDGFDVAEQLARS